MESGREMHFRVQSLINRIEETVVFFHPLMKSADQWDNANGALLAHLNGTIGEMGMSLVLTDAGL